MSETVRGKTLDEAKNLVDNDRNTQYGEPIDDFSKVVGALNSYGYRGPGGRLLTPHDVPFVQIVVKLSRLVQTPKKSDSWIDIAGYAACGNEVSQQQEESSAQNKDKLNKNATWRWTPPITGVGTGILELVFPAGSEEPTEHAIRTGLAEVATALAIHAVNPSDRVKQHSANGTWSLVWDAVKEVKDGE